MYRVIPYIALVASVVLLNACAVVVPPGPPAPAYAYSYSYAYGYPYYYGPPVAGGAFVTIGPRWGWGYPHHHW